MSPASQPTILLIGGTGKVGAAAANALTQAGADFAIGGRTSERRIDHDDPATYPTALQGVDRLLVISPDRPDLADVEQRLYAAASEAGVQRVVKLSAASAGWDPPASFGRPHAEAEAALRASGLEWTILRPTVFQQTIGLFADDMAKGRLVTPRCRGAVAFVSIDDIAEVAATALTDAGFGGRTLELTGPEAHTFPEVAELAGSTLGRRVKHRNLPHRLARRVLPRVAGLSRWEAGMLVDLFEGLDRGQQATVSNDVETTLVREAAPLRQSLPSILGT